MQDERITNDTILIVEDSQTQAEMLRHILEEEHFKVLHAINGQKALEILKKEIPFIIVSDILMPVMNGYELSKAVNRDDRLKNIPLILLTSLSDTEDVLRGLDCQADFFILKTKLQKTLLARIHAILEDQKDVQIHEPYYEQKLRYRGSDHVIHSTPGKTLNLLLSTYEIAVNRNHELLETQGQLQREIERRAELELELKKAKNAAEAANRAKSTFLANMSHEIRTPMNAILGFSQLMLREQGILPLQRERLETINRSGEHLLSLINDILDISKIEAGRTMLYLTTFDLHGMLKEIETMFRVRTDAKNLRLILERDPGLERYILSDEGKLRQILINLIGNAVKFTLDGGIAVRAKTVQKTNKVLELIIEIEDTGSGIAEDEISSLFQIFEQTESGLQEGGTGLGLALSQKFSKLLGGDITYKNLAGSGSCFVLSIPVETGAASDVHGIAVSRQIVGLKVDEGPLRVLIVDDKKDNRVFLAEILEFEDFELRQAIDGAEAIHCFEEWRPHLILMDLRMPGIDGYEATQRIRSMEGGMETRIIIVTATAFEGDMNLLLNSGADDHIRKPFRINEVYEMIGRYVPVHYVYDTELPLVEKESMEIYRGVLGQMPDELMKSLKHATINAQLDILLDLIDKIGEKNENLAERLRELANNFQYEALLSLFENRGV